MGFLKFPSNFSHFCITFRNSKFSIFDVYLTVYLNLVVVVMSTELARRIQDALSVISPAHQVAPVVGEIVDSKEADKLRLQD